MFSGLAHSSSAFLHDKTSLRLTLAAFQPPYLSSRGYHEKMMVYFFAFLVSVVTAAGIADLEGTWSTKSRQVITGPVRLDRPCRRSVALTFWISRASTTPSRMSFSSPS